MSGVAFYTIIYVTTTICPQYSQLHFFFNDEEPKECKKIVTKQIVLDKERIRLEKIKGQ